MDDDLKLVDQLLFEATAGHMTSVTRDVMANAAEAITRLRAEIEDLKSDVSDLVRAGSDEATENERLVREREGCSLGVGCYEVGICFAMSQGQPDRCGRTPSPDQREIDAIARAEAAEAQRDAALGGLRDIKAYIEHQGDRATVADIARAASRTLEGE